MKLSSARGNKSLGAVCNPNFHLPLAKLGQVEARKGFNLPALPPLPTPQGLEGGGG